MSLEYARSYNKIGVITLPSSGTPAQRRYELELDTGVFIVTGGGGNFVMKFGDETVDADIAGTVRVDYHRKIKDGFAWVNALAGAVGGSTHVSFSAASDFDIDIDETG